MISFLSRLYAYGAATVWGWWMSGLLWMAGGTDAVADDAHDVFPEEASDE